MMNNSAGHNSAGNGSGTIISNNIQNATLIQNGDNSSLLNPSFKKFEDWRTNVIADWRRVQHGHRHSTLKFLSGEGAADHALSTLSDVKSTSPVKKNVATRLFLRRGEPCCVGLDVSKLSNIRKQLIGIIAPGQFHDYAKFRVQLADKSGKNKDFSAKVSANVLDSLENVIANNNSSSNKAYNKSTEKSDTVFCSFTIPENLPVGRYGLELVLSVENEKQHEFNALHNLKLGDNQIVGGFVSQATLATCDAIVLFNPFFEEDSNNVENSCTKKNFPEACDSEDISNSVLEDCGWIPRGSLACPWNFAQFDAETVAVLLLVLSRADSESRKEPLKFSAFVANMLFPKKNKKSKNLSASAISRQKLRNEFALTDVSRFSSTSTVMAACLLTNSVLDDNGIFQNSTVPPQAAAGILVSLLRCAGIGSRVVSVLDTPGAYALSQATTSGAEFGLGVDKLIDGKSFKPILNYGDKTGKSIEKGFDTNLVKEQQNLDAACGSRSDSHCIVDIFANHSFHFIDVSCSGVISNVNALGPVKASDVFKSSVLNFDSHSNHFARLFGGNVRYFLKKPIEDSVTELDFNQDPKKKNGSDYKLIHLEPNSIAPQINVFDAENKLAIDIKDSYHLDPPKSLAIAHRPQPNMPKGNQKYSLRSEFVGRPGDFRTPLSEQKKICNFQFSVPRTQTCEHEAVGLIAVANLPKHYECLVSITCCSNFSSHHMMSNTEREILESKEELIDLEKLTNISESEQKAPRSLTIVLDHAAQMKALAKGARSVEFIAFAAVREKIERLDPKTNLKIPKVIHQAFASSKFAEIQLPTLTITQDESATQKKDDYTLVYVTVELTNPFPQALRNLSLKACVSGPAEFAEKIMEDREKDFGDFGKRSKIDKRGGSVVFDENVKDPKSRGKDSALNDAEKALNDDRTAESVPYLEGLAGHIDPELLHNLQNALKIAPESLKPGDEKRDKKKLFSRDSLERLGNPEGNEGNSPTNSDGGKSNKSAKTDKSEAKSEISVGYDTLNKAKDLAQQASAFVDDFNDPVLSHAHQIAADALKFLEDKGAEVTQVQQGLAQVYEKSVDDNLTGKAESDRLKLADKSRSPSPNLISNVSPRDLRSPSPLQSHEGSVMRPMSPFAEVSAFGSIYPSEAAVTIGSLRKEMQTVVTEEQPPIKRPRNRCIELRKYLNRFVKSAGFIQPNETLRAHLPAIRMETGHKYNNSDANDVNDENALSLDEVCVVVKLDTKEWGGRDGATELLRLVV